MQQNKLLKAILLVCGVFILCFVTSIYIFAWTGPTEDPPGGDVSSIVKLAPDTIQSDASSTPSIWINKTAIGNLLDLQSGGASQLIVGYDGNVIMESGKLSLKEAIAPGASAGYGRLYVASADSKLYFKDDSGIEYDLTAPGGASQLTDLSNVTIAAPADNEVLTYELSTGLWKNAPGGAGGGIGGSGTSTQIAFFSDSTTLGSDSNLYWDNINKRLGIGTATQGAELEVDGSIFLDGDLTFRPYNHRTISVETTNQAFNLTIQPGYNGPFSESGNLIFATGEGTERMRIDKFGNVGIGTSIDPGTYKLDVDGRIRARSGIYSYGGSINLGDGNLYVQSGYVGLGTTGPNAKLDIRGTTAASSMIKLTRHSENIYEPYIRFFKYRGTSAAPTSVAVGDRLGSIDFYGYDGLGEEWAGGIKQYVEGISANNISTSFRIYTDEVGLIHERMRISDTGALGFNGANYGASGQVLTSQGVASAPVWSGISAANTSLSNLSSVAINTDLLPSGWVNLGSTDARFNKIWLGTIDMAHSAGTSISLINSGSNAALDIHKTDTLGTANLGFMTYAGAGRMFELQQNNASNPNTMLYLWNGGTGHVIQGNGAYLSNGGVWVDSSTREKKENYEEPDIDKLIEAIKQLSVYKYNYKSESDDFKHISPVSEDVYSLFGVGDDKSISSKDLSGINMVIIKNLLDRIENLENQL